MKHKWEVLVTTSCQKQWSLTWNGVLFDFMLTNREGLFWRCEALAVETMRLWNSVLGEEGAGQQVRS